MSKSISDVLQLAKEGGAKILDLKFMDFPGLWQHFSTPISLLTQCKSCAVRFWPKEWTG